MKSPNYILRLRYREVLANIAPTYYNQVPNKAFGNYFVINGITSTDNSTKTSFDIDTTIQIVCHTEDLSTNDGKALEDMADQALAGLMPTPYKGVVLDNNFQNGSTSIASDVVQNWTNNQGYSVMERIITFRHRIHQKN